MATRITPTRNDVLALLKSEILSLPPGKQAYPRNLLSKYGRTADGLVVKRLVQEINEGLETRICCLKAGEYRFYHQ